MTTPLSIWAATPTPFDASRRLDLSVVAQQAKHLVDTGVDGVFVTGTTGEFWAMSADERAALLSEWRDQRASGFGLGAHVGHTQLAEAQRLASHAEECGVDMIATVAPYYGESASVDRIVGFLADVAAAAPGTPFCLYHIPSMTGSRHRVSDVVAEAVRRIPTLGYVKFTHSDLLEFDRVRSISSDVKVFFGSDELLPAALAFGADRVIGSLYNGFAPIARAVAEAAANGDAERAFELHAPFRAIAATAGDNGGLGFVKELLNEFGPDAGPARAPWGPIGDRERVALRELSETLRPALAAAAGGRGRS
jgi:N-acetylneuraminate lyase